MNKVRVGLVGTGFVARIHMAAYTHLKAKAEVVGVTSGKLENARAFARQWGIPKCFPSYEEMLSDPDIDLIDICTPTHLHGRMIIQAANARKHVACEKPLTGYFGQADGAARGVGRIGESVSRAEMLKEVLRELDAIEQALKESGVRFLYGENFVYAPGVEKFRRLLRVSKGRVLDLRAEESHSGSHAAYSRRWATSGGGSLLRMGAHPVGAVLHLKDFEGRLRDGRPIRPVSVSAEVASVTRSAGLNAQNAPWLVTDWEDVEDWAAAFIRFEDGTMATVISTDVSLGGVKNIIHAYLSNSVVQININPNNSMQIYAPIPEIFGDEYITEKVETKAGWNFPSPDEDWTRGYPQQMADFIDALLENREPLSDFRLARQVVEVIYAAYQSAEEGRRISLAREPLQPSAGE